MNEKISEMKAALREQMRTLSLGVDQRQRADASQIITSSLLGLVGREAAGNKPLQVALFRSFKDEVDLSLFEKGLVDLEIPFQIVEHADSLKEYPSIIIVPGMAFDLAGARVGRGKGCYDRILCNLRIRNHSKVAIGVGYDHQLVDSVPTEPHDERVDFLCMPSLGLRACQ